MSLLEPIPWRRLGYESARDLRNVLYFRGIEWKHLEYTTHRIRSRIQSGGVVAASTIAFPTSSLQSRMGSFSFPSGKVSGLSAGSSGDNQQQPNQPPNENDLLPPLGALKVHDKDDFPTHVPSMLLSFIIKKTCSHTHYAYPYP